MLRKSEKGQALVLIVAAIIGLFGITALTVDGGIAYSDRRNAQNAADSAALASALAKIRGQDYQDVAFQSAAVNGYDNDGVLDSVEVYNPPTDGPYAGNSEYIQVIITSTTNTYFGGIIGVQEVTNKVQAVARAKAGGPQPMFDGAALVTLKTTGTTLIANGNIDLDINDSGVFVNSSDPICAMSVNGNVNLEVDTAYQIVGTYCQNGNVSVSGPIQQGVEQIPYPPPLDIPAPTIECLNDGHQSGNTYYPGNYDNILINGNGNYTFAPGNYCVSGGVTVNGNINLTANDVSFHLTGHHQFTINGNSRLTCNNMVIHSDGGTGVLFNGNATNVCHNVVFYMETGSVTWNGNVANTFTAPTTGPAAGLLIYMPYGNSSSLVINGNSGNEITGSIVAVQSPIIINGNSGTNGYDSQIIGYTITLNGNSDTTINYDDADNYDAVSPGIIELAQ